MQLLHGDCLELIEQIPDHSVDMVLCDLPYGVLDLAWDERIDGKRLFSEYKRVCKQNSNVLLFCQIEFAKYLMESTLHTIGFGIPLIIEFLRKKIIGAYKRLPNALQNHTKK